MAKKKSSSTDLATTSTDALAGVLDDLDLGTDGLEEIDNEDIKIPLKVFNMKGTDRAGDPIPANVFYDTVTEETQKELTGQLLTLTKSNEWREYDEQKGESITHCRSFDRKIGTMRDGNTRACDGCPHAQWRQQDGKPTRDCGTVYSLLGVDEEEQPFILRLKKTSIRPIKTYLNRYFLGKRVVGGKRGNYPLFAFATRVILKMVDGKYAVPEFERGEVLDREQILRGKENAEFYREVMMPALQRAADTDRDEGTPASSVSPDTSFNPNEFSDDEDAPAAPNAF